MQLSKGHGINSSSFSSDVELDGTEFGSFFCSGSEDVFGRLLPNCVGLESTSGMDGCVCPGCVDKTEN